VPGTTLCLGKLGAGMADSAEVRALVEKGYLRTKDIAPILGVTVKRVSQIVTERGGLAEAGEGSRTAPVVATRGRGANRSSPPRVGPSVAAPGSGAWAQAGPSYRRKRSYTTPT
jgi:hypothetical protein